MAARSAQSAEEALGALWVRWQRMWAMCVNHMGLTGCPLILKTQGHRQHYESARGHPFHTVLGVSLSTLLTARPRPGVFVWGEQWGGQERRGTEGAVVSPQGGQEGAVHWSGEVSWTDEPWSPWEHHERHNGAQTLQSTTTLLLGPRPSAASVFATRSVSSHLLLTARQVLEFPFCRWRN